MKRRLKKYLSRTFLVLILIALLVGCGGKTTLEVPKIPQPTSGRTITLSTETPFSTQELIETVRPTITKPALSTRSAISTAFTATPSEVDASPSPFLSPTPIHVALPFHDCARTPGITGCDPSAPGLAGHMAFYDVESSRLVGLDLKTGQGWAVPIHKPKALEWAPDGSQLLVRINFPKDEPYEYLLFEKGGKLIRQFTQNKTVYWQPQGAELRTYDERKIVHSQDGGEAWLERTLKIEKILHFRTSKAADWKTVTLDLKELPTDLYGWLPGTSKIIITYGPNSVQNDVMHGHSLYLFDTTTGKLSYLKNFHGHLDPQFAALHEPDLALIQINWGLANDRLAILNGETGDISYPLPHIQSEIQPYSLWQLAWQPGQGNNEGLFVMMVRMLRTNISNPPPAIPMFPTDGIYLYDRAAGQAQIVRETGEDFTGGNFHWTADGQYLLYSLGPFQSPEDAQASLYVRQISTGKEWLVLDRLVNPNQFRSYIDWNLIAISMD